MEDPSFTHQLFETWRLTNDWVKAVAIVTPAVCLTWFLISAHRWSRGVRGPVGDRRVRALVKAEMCRIIAEWERTRIARPWSEVRPGQAFGEREDGKA